MHSFVQNIRPRKDGVAFRKPFGAKSIHWAQSLARPEAHRTFLTSLAMMWTAKRFQVCRMRRMLYVATVKGVRAHAEKVLFHSFKFICIVLVCVWLLWLRPGPVVGPFVGVMLYAGSITSEGGRMPKAFFLSKSCSCGCEAKAGWLRCRAHFSFILGIARGTAPVIIRQSFPILR